MHPATDVSNILIPFNSHDTEMFSRLAKKDPSQRYFVILMLDGTKYIGLAQHPDAFIQVDSNFKHYFVIEEMNNVLIAITEFVNGCKLNSEHLSLLNELKHQIRTFKEIEVPPTRSLSGKELEEKWKLKKVREAASLHLKEKFIFQLDNISKEISEEAELEKFLSSEQIPANSL